MLEILKKGFMKKGIVTRNYPAEPYRPVTGCQGRPTIDAGRCDMCGKCAAACPAQAISVGDGVEISLARCIFCAACRDACPAEAISITGEVELASRSKESLQVTYR